MDPLVFTGPEIPETIAVGRLEKTDLPDLAGLYRQFRGEESDLSKMRRVFDRLAQSPDHLLLAARQNRRLVGSALGVVSEELYGDCRPFLVIEDMIVNERDRRRGIGAALMKTLERFANKRGCGYIMLITDTDRTAARRFYEALGYNTAAFTGVKKYL